VVALRGSAEGREGCGSRVMAVPGQRGVNPTRCLVLPVRRSDVSMKKLKPEHGHFCFFFIENGCGILGNPDGRGRFPRSGHSGSYASRVTKTVRVELTSNPGAGWRRS